MHPKKKQKKRNLLILLGLEENSSRYDYKKISAHYHEKKAQYEARLETTDDIIDRIALQNQMIELQDHFLDYQSARINYDSSLKRLRKKSS